MRISTILLALIAMFPLIAPSCQTQITYHQVGACNGGRTQFGEYNAGPNQAYVIFAIENIDNTQNTNAFPYDPKNIFWTQNPKSAFDSNLEIYRYKLGPFATVPVTVNAGRSIGFNPNGYGALVVQTTAADGASEANNTSYFLGYQNVLMNKSNSNRTSWPYTPNCADIVLE